MQPVLHRTGSQKQNQLNIFHITILLDAEYHYLLEVLIPQITIMPFASFVNILCTISLQVLSRYTELPENYSSLKCMLIRHPTPLIIFRTNLHHLAWETNAKNGQL